MHESDLHPISPKAPARQYKPVQKKEEKGKTVEYEKGASILGQRKNIGPALETRPSRTTEKGSAR